MDKWIGRYIDKQTDKEKDERMKGTTKNSYFTHISSYTDTRVERRSDSGLTMAPWVLLLHE